MQSTGAAHAAAPETSWQETRPRPKQRARRTSHPAAGRPVPPQRMRWTGAANIALTVLLIVAAFGAVRAFEGSLPFDLGGDNGPAEPRLAAVPGTPDESILPAVQVSPEATPDAAADAAFACDFSQSVPIYSGVDAPPADGTVLYIASNGDFTLSCPEQPDPIVLSRDVSSAWATAAPGVVQIQIPDGNTTSVVMMNVITNDWIELNPNTFSSYLGDANMMRSLQVYPVVDSPTEWSLLNLETMQSATLSDLTGAKYPASSHIIVATSADQEGVAVATSEYRSEGSATLTQSPGALGDIAVIEDDLETVHWISVPSYFPEVTNISLSPDASKVAIISNLTSFNNPAETTAISIVDVATGEEIVRSEEFIPSMSAFFQWVEDGEAIIYTTESTVNRLELEPGATETEIFASDGTLMLMPTTTQSNILHLKESINDAESNLLILTTDTGDAATVAGDPWFLGSTPVMPWTEELAPIVVHPNDDGGMTQVVHPVTGQSIIDAVDAPPLSTPSPDQQVWMPQQLVTRAEEAPVSIVDPGNGEMIAIDLGGDEPNVITVPALPEDDSGRLRLSPDGNVLIAGQGTWEGEEGPWWSLDLSDPESEWVQGPEGSVVTWLVPIDE